MINRYYIRCDTCATHHTLRVQIGYGADQVHRFCCHRCSEPIEFDLYGLANSGPAVTGASLCEPADEPVEKTSYQYLSTDFVADERSARDPQYFGAMDFMDAMSKTPHAKKILAQRTPEILNEPRWFALTDAPSDWKMLQRCWRLERNGQYDLAAQTLTASTRAEDNTSVWMAVLNFTEQLFGCNDSLMNEVIAIHKQHTQEFSRLAAAHAYSWAKDWREGQYLIFDAFFKRWAAFSQVYLYVKNSAAMPEKPVSTSVNFEEIRGFYSVAQEFFSKQIGLLTALNNIRLGRPFDKLQNISLDKYLVSDNAKRRDNFTGNPVLMGAASEYDSGLRNAEAHNWVRLQPDGDTLAYRQGNAGDETLLPYARYLFKCTTLLKQICHLMQVEYLLAQDARVVAQRLLSPSR
ncbi:hypothetical protein AB4Z46_32980 [Variovorax sp. M-6]|uniref:hypothetical protein n=1 Tax=Variovorax sp. M-6 TaxID=3233041 RepID=UPI003F9CC3B8